MMCMVHYSNSSGGDLLRTIKTWQKFDDDDNVDDGDDDDDDGDQDSFNFTSFSWKLGKVMKLDKNGRGIGQNKRQKK